MVGNQPLSEEDTTQLIVCQYPEEEEGEGPQSRPLEDVPEQDIHFAPTSGTCSPDIKVALKLKFRMVLWTPEIADYKYSQQLPVTL